MLINWKPDRSKKEYLQSQIYRYVVEQISSGSWSLGTKLPSERLMSEQLQVNRSTISIVMDELKSEGILEGKGSRGTFVANNTWSLLASNPQPNWKKYITNGIHEPNQKIIQKINHYEFRENIIRLGTGEIAPELFPTDLMEKVMKKITLNLNSMNYEEPLGQYPLRVAIANYLKKYDMEVNPNQILITSGSLQGLHLISIGMMQVGSTVYTEKTSYVKSLSTFQSAGMRLEGVPMDESGLSIECLKKQIKKSGTNLLYTIPTFQNPTGKLMDQTRRSELLEFISEYRIPVIEDDAYRELWLDEEPPLPLKSFDKAGNIIYAGTLSKCFSPGIRIGWIVGPQPVVERLGDIKMQTDYGSSSISQMIALEWISGGYYEEYQNRIRKILRKKRDLVMTLLETHFNDFAKWERPKGGFYVWTKLQCEINMVQLFNEALKENILINIGNIYDYSENKAIRLSYAYASEEELRYGIEKLANIIRKISRH